MCRATGSILVKKSARFEVPSIFTTVNRFCLTLSRIQSNRMSIDLDFFGRTVEVANPMAHKLSTKTGVGGWGYPRLAMAGLAFYDQNSAGAGVLPV